MWHLLKQRTGPPRSRTQGSNLHQAPILSEKVGLLCKHSFTTNPWTSYSSNQTAAPKILLYRNSGISLGSSEFEPYRWIQRELRGVKHIKIRCKAVVLIHGVLKHWWVEVGVGNVYTTFAIID